MNRRHFLYWVAGIILLFIFVSIYYYNRVVKIQYEIQRIEKDKVVLAKLFDQCRAQFCTLKDARLVKNEAMRRFGFSNLKLSQVMTLDDASTKIDFLKSSTSTTHTVNV